jgi:hypothetical protein
MGGHKHIVGQVADGSYINIFEWHMYMGITMVVLYFLVGLR